METSHITEIDLTTGGQTLPLSSGNGNIGRFRIFDIMLY